MNPEQQTADRDVRLFVDGAWAESDSEQTVDVINPSLGRRCGVIPAGSARDVDRAVASARRAFAVGLWRNAPPSQKRQTLLRLADLITADGAHLDALDAQEMGKPISEQFCNAAAAATLLRFYAEAVDKITGDVYASDCKSLVAQRWAPRGVVAAIVPWNFPTYNAVLKCAPALAAGNCVVLKPSELASRSACRLATLAAQAGLPSGVLNVVPGLGETVGRALGLHAEVDMVTFTGSTDVGKRMQQYAGQSNMKVVLTECGGKSPQIVFDDGLDLDAVSLHVARFLLTNQGQICSVGARLLVQRSIQNEMVERIATHFKHVVIGNALDSSTTFGPLASAKQRARVLRYIEAASADGAQLVTGGRAVLNDSGGYFVEPTLFRGVSAQHSIAQEEVFGPVLSVISFEDEAEAIRIANGTMYGLLAYLWTSDLSRGLRVAKDVQSSILVNAAAPSGEGPGHAFSSEPAKQSGVGTEGGMPGLQSYMRRQLIWINHA